MLITRIDKRLKRVNIMLRRRIRMRAIFVPCNAHALRVTIFNFNNKFNQNQLIQLNQLKINSIRREPF